MQDWHDDEQVRSSMFATGRNGRSVYFREMDSIWRAIRPWGRFQTGQMILVLLGEVPASIAIFSAVFTGYIPEYNCTPPSRNDNDTFTPDYNITYNAHKCYYDVIAHKNNTSTVLETRSCDHFSYSMENTYAVEWTLTCSRSNLAALAQSLVLAGQGIGALSMSHVADRFGRKTVHVISNIGVLCTMVVMAFSRNIYMLLAFRLIAGIFQQGIVCAGTTLNIELFPVEARSHTIPLINIFWVLGMMISSLLGYIFRDLDWRYLQLALAACSLYSLAEWWILEESTRWLFSNGRFEDAKRIIKKAAKQNKVDFNKIEDILKETSPLTDKLDAEVTQKDMGMEHNEHSKAIHDETEEIDDSLKEEKVKKYTVIDILRNPQLRVDTLILWYLWIVGAGVYFGLTLVSTHLAGDRFINFCLSGVFELPPSMMCFFLYNRIGRKKTMILWYGLAGVSLVVSTVLLTVLAESAVAATTATVFSLLGKAGISGAFNTCFLYTPEIYPTNYRNSGLGIASSVSRIGALLAPFASNLALISLWIPGAIFGGMCLLVVILAVRLPESARHELPTTIEDFEKWNSEKK